MWLRLHREARLAKHLPILALGVVAACIAAASAQTPRPQLPPLQVGQYLYEARTNEPARTQGNVVTASITWACQGNVCSTRGPWPRPGVPACHALALQVGVITSYGRSGAMLTPAQLAECNAGVATPSVIAPGVRVTPSQPIRRPAASPTPTETPPPETPPAETPPSATPPPATPPPDTPTLTTDASGAIVVNATQLSLVGGAMRDVSDRIGAPIVVNASELSLVGGAAVDVSDRAAPAIVVNTSELSLVGR